MAHLFDNLPKDKELDIISYNKKLNNKLKIKISDYKKSKFMNWNRNNSQRKRI